MVAGDFNEILCDSEKKGGRPRAPWQTRNFRKALESTNLYDLGYEGGPFTWCNRHPDPDTIYERLDRAYADPAWRNRFSDSIVHHIPVTSSDHSAILIDTENARQQPRPKHRPFRFEAEWASSEDCEQEVKEGWNEGTNNFLPSLFAKLSSCAARLKVWNIEKGSLSLKRQIKQCEKKLTWLRKQPITTTSKLEESKIRADIERLLAKDEVYWKQRGRSIGFGKGT
ncbi:UNVERIFIED_CONTAM: hypothetical protein Slati_2341400 [Sesamum latifolium]|uniref:Endonuclease/exonuclease/phosphatase domain-containing protein n=1 Tax=Sesamum latifolium TaxID=2727402 RepID=A0AAW2WB55_9LAMI